MKCLDWKFTYIQGIQRSNQRELGHIKDNVCNRCGEVKTMEVRYCDYLPDIMKKAIRKHNELYDDNKQALDRVRNNLTNEQVMRNTVGGKYNVKR